MYIYIYIYIYIYYRQNLSVLQPVSRVHNAQRDATEPHSCDLSRIDQTNNNHDGNIN